MCPPGYFGLYCEHGEYKKNFRLLKKFALNFALSWPAFITSVEAIVSKYFRIPKIISSFFFETWREEYRDSMVLILTVNMYFFIG